MSSSWQTTLIGIMSTMLVTGLISWFSFGGGVRADEVKRMIADAPSVVTLNGNVDRLKKDIEDLSKKVDQNNNAAQEKLDRILQQLPRDDGR